MTTLSPLCLVWNSADWKLVRPLLQYSNNCVRPSSGVPITMFGKQYLELHFLEVDKLCQWILDTRAQHEKSYKMFLKAVDEASKKADSSADSLIVTGGTAYGTQGKNEGAVSDACESSTDTAIDIAQAIKTNLKIWTVVEGMALYKEDR